MKKFCSLIAVALIILLFIPTSVAEADDQCPGCKGYETYIMTGTYDVKESTVFCYATKYFEELCCHECTYSIRILDEPIDYRFHILGGYQDMGCSNGIHTWGRPCNYSDCNYVKIYKVYCPGPPYCVSPMSIGDLAPF